MEYCEQTLNLFFHCCPYEKSRSDRAYLRCSAMSRQCPGGHFLQDIVDRKAFGFSGELYSLMIRSLGRAALSVRQSSIEVSFFVSIPVSLLVPFWVSLFLWGAFPCDFHCLCNCWHCHPNGNVQLLSRIFFSAFFYVLFLSPPPISLAAPSPDLDRVTWCLWLKVFPLIYSHCHSSLETQWFLQANLHGILMRCFYFLLLRLGHSHVGVIDLDILLLEEFLESDHFRWIAFILKWEKSPLNVIENFSRTFYDLGI